MQPVNIIDLMVQTTGQTIGNSITMTLVIVGFAAAAFFILIQKLREPPRFDALRHMEQPPIEHQPTRSLPPASAYREYEQAQDKEKARVPWE
jgi:hypothetical protein